MNAKEARAITDEPWYLKQIRRVAESGQGETVLEIVDWDHTKSIQKDLTDRLFECGKIRKHDNHFGCDFTMKVKW